MPTCEETFDKTLDHICKELLIKQSDDRGQAFSALKQCDDFDPNFLLQGSCLLKIAVDMNDYPFSHFLINCGANINGPDPLKEKTPLEVAWENRNYGLCELLLIHNADVTVPTASQKTLLGEALEDCKQNGEQYFADLFESLHFKPEHFQCENRETPLNQAIKNGDIQTCSELLQLGANPNFFSPATHEIPLINAVFLGNSDVLYVLLQHGANPNVCDQYGNTPLLIASTRTHANKNMVKDLLDHGANFLHQNRQGRSVLKNLITLNYEDLALRTLHPHNLQEPPLSINSTPLSMAVAHNLPKLVKEMSETILNHNLPTQLVSRPGKFGNTPLMLAAYLGYHHMMDDLLPLNPVNWRSEARKKEEIGSTALMLAASLGHHQCVEKLLLAGADANLVTNDGQTALSMAITGLGKMQTKGTAFKSANKNITPEEDAANLIAELTKREENYYINIYITVKHLLDHGAQCDFKIKDAAFLTQEDKTSNPQLSDNDVTIVQRLNTLTTLAEQDYKASSANEKPILLKKKKVYMPLKTW